MEKIVIKVPKPTSTCTGVIRLNRDAEEVIRKLSYQSGLSASFLVSQIICQAEPLVVIHREEA